MKPRYIYKWGVGPVLIKEIRVRITRDTNKLRRARRLYFWLCYDFIMNAETERPLWDIAKKCQDRGLYGSLSLKDVKNSVLGHLFKISKYKGWEPNGWSSRGWHEWIREHDFDMPGSAYNQNRVRHQRKFEVA